MEEAKDSEWAGPGASPLEIADHSLTEFPVIKVVVFGVNQLPYATPEDDHFPCYAD